MINLHKTDFKFWVHNDLLDIVCISDISYYQGNNTELSTSKFSGQNLVCAESHAADNHYGEDYFCAAFGGNHQEHLFHLVAAFCYEAVAGVASGGDAGFFECLDVAGLLDLRVEVVGEFLEPARSVPTGVEKMQQNPVGFFCEFLSLF